VPFVGSVASAARISDSAAAVLIAVCALFGVPAEVALAMALIKRVPDLILGAPALMGWQALEGRHYLGAGDEKISEEISEI
jgi:hypothetical protein